MSIEMASALRALHEGEELFVLPNPCDLGSAKLCEHLGFAAVATSSAGFARAIGRPDAARAVSRDEAIAHAAEMVEALSIPVTGDLEDGFGVAPTAAAETVTASRQAGLAGCCIEDATYDRGDPVHPIDLATERIVAAADAAHADDHPFVLTARAENFLYGRADLDDTIARLKRFVAAGADAVYAPGLISLDDIGRVCAQVEAPVNVLIGLPGQDYGLDELAAVGVRRVSVGSGFSRAAFAGVYEKARQLRDERRLTPVEGAVPDLDAIFS